MRRSCRAFPGTPPGRGRWQALQDHWSARPQLFPLLLRPFLQEPTTADLPCCPYSEAVIKEALRLFPPAHTTNRECTAPGGCTLVGADGRSYHIPEASGGCIPDAGLPEPVLRTLRWRFCFKLYVRTEPCLQQGSCGMQPAAGATCLPPCVPPSQAQHAHVPPELLATHAPLASLCLYFPDGQGTWVHFNIYGMHRSEELWGPDALAFRWVADSPGAACHPVHIVLHRTLPRGAAVGASYMDAANVVPVCLPSLQRSWLGDRSP